jgi:hypothetical protein
MKRFPDEDLGVNNDELELGTLRASESNNMEGRWQPGEKRAGSHSLHICIPHKTPACHYILKSFPPSLFLHVSFYPLTYSR